MFTDDDITVVTLFEEAEEGGGGGGGEGGGLSLEVLEMRDISVTTDVRPLR